MDDTHKTKEQLINELQELRRQNASLKKSVGAVTEAGKDSIVDEEMLRALFSSIHLGVVYQDSQGRIVTANPAAERILGISLDQMQGRSSMDPRWRSIHEDGSDFPGEEHPAMVALETGKSLSNVVMGVFHPAENEYRWISINSIPQFKEGQEKPYQVCVTFDDITDRKAAERALRESEERYKILFDESPVSIWEEDYSVVKTRIDELHASGMENFRDYLDRNEDVLAELTASVRVVDVNTATFELYEVNTKETLFENLNTFLSEKSYDVFKEGLIALEKGDTRFESEAVNLNSRGDEIQILIRWSLPQGCENSWSRIFVSMIDVSDRRKVEDDLRESEATLRAFFNAIDDSALLVDLNGITLAINEVAAKKLGSTPEKMIGHDTRKYIPQDVYESRKAMGDEMIRTRKPLRFQDERDGMVFDHVFYPVFTENGDVTATAIISRDITEQKKAENALRQSEEKFRFLAENSRDMIYRMSLPDGVYEYVSPASIELMGYSPEEIYKHPMMVRDSIHPDSLVFFQKEWSKLISGDVPPSYTYKIIDKSGETKWMYQRNVLIRDSNGKPVAIEGSVTDLTEIRKAEEQLQRYKHFFNNIELGLAIGSPDGKTLDMINPAYARMHGYSVEELSGKPILDICAPDYREELSEQILKIHEQGHQVYEADHMRKDGTIFPALHDALAVKDDQGAVMYHAVIVQDITRQKEAEAAIRRSMEEYLSITNLTGEIIVHVNAKGEWIFLSDGACEFWGDTREKLLGNLFQDYVYPDDREKTADFIRDIIVSGKMRKGFVNRQKTPNGWRTVEWNAIPEYDEAGQYIGLKTTGRDITERILLEEQLRIRERMDSLGTLAGGIAHDFNNLLAGIIGNIDLLRMESDMLTPYQRESIDEASKSSQRAAKLIRDFQGLTKKTITDPVAVDIFQIAEEVFSILERTTDRMIRKEQDIEPSVCYIKGYPDQLHQVLLNLGTNAIHAIEQKGVCPEDCIRITAEDVTLFDAGVFGLKEGEYIHITFSDTGVGMSDDVKKRIFEPLFTTKSRSAQKGQGLGLAMVYNIIVQNHSGYINVDSRENAGTTFHIYLPKSPPQKYSKVKEKVEIVGGSETVLIIEDEEMVRRMARRILEKYGYTVLVAADGLEGVKIFQEKQNSIDLVLLDLTMPRRSGRMVLEDILAINPDTRVIISSGRSEDDIRELTQAKGYVQKPYNINKFLKTIREVLDA